MFTQAGLQRRNNLFANKDTTEDLYVRLYENTYTFTSTTVAADLTECTATGYAALQIDPADLTTTWDAVEGKAKTEYTGSQSWTLTGGVTVTGWFITNAAGDEVYAGGDKIISATDVTINLNALDIFAGQE